MNAKAAKCINRLTANARPGMRNALKAEWARTPANERHALLERFKRTQYAMETYEPKVEDYAPRAG